MTYKHLTQEEQYQIHALKRQNVSLARIGAELQRVFRRAGLLPLGAHVKQVHEEVSNCALLFTGS